MVKLGEKVFYKGKHGTVTELYAGGSRGIITTADGLEYTIECDLVIQEDTKRYCPFCISETGRKEEIFVSSNGLLKRCLCCERDFKDAVISETNVEDATVKGMRSILG